MFQLWTQVNTVAQENLKPNLGLRSWSELDQEDKRKIWHHLNNVIHGGGIHEIRTYLAIYELNRLYKARAYAKQFLQTPDRSSAKSDFYAIFFHEEDDVVLELLSLLGQAILAERNDPKDFRSKFKDETEEGFNELLTRWQYQNFDAFAKQVNDVFDHFGLNITVTRMGIFPKQDQTITKEIYEPVLRILSNKKWAAVDRDLRDATKKYQEGDYSASITHSASALQAFLQMTVYGKTGKGDIKDLINIALSRELIPNDVFSKEAFKNLESSVMSERRKKGNPHPKKEYADEKHARLILNLIMVFMQHCLQK